MRAASIWTSVSSAIFCLLLISFPRLLASVMTKMALSSSRMLPSDADRICRNINTTNVECCMSLILTQAKSISSQCMSLAAPQENNEQSVMIDSNTDRLEPCQCNKHNLASSPCQWQNPVRADGWMQAGHLKDLVFNLLEPALVVSGLYNKLVALLFQIWPLLGHNHPYNQLQELSVMHHCKLHVMSL